MIILEGNGLCERQKQLNFKVNEAAHNKVDFQEIKVAKEYSDVDRLFKIDLASKYRNIDYLMEQLLSADSLYISRVLKCEWIYSKDYAHVINPEYLHQNIFPSMSIKMKKKTLTTISLYVRDEARARIFYEYCIDKRMKMNAYKFLIFTSESYKQQFLNNNDLDFLPIDKNFIGNSLLLADIYVSKGGNMVKLSYLYRIYDVEYLNLIEKVNFTQCYYYNGPTLTGKISRDILKKHKTKIIKNPLPYLKVLRTKELLKFSSSDDARVYAAALLPDDVSEFWGSNYWNYCKGYKHIIDLVKKEDHYIFLKQIFSNKYPKEEFEMNTLFYQRECYKFMTVKERETWALVHLDKQTGVIPEDDDYRWYEFVNFPLAFKEIKKKILLTTNEDKRSKMLITLTMSAKTQKEVEELLTYYYNRHVNEKKHLTENFLSNVIEQHSALIEFDEACWSALNKLFHSLNIYFSDAPSYMKDVFRVHSLIYHIIYKQTLPSGLDYLDQVCLFIAQRENFTKQLSKENKKLVYEYVVQFYSEQIKGFDSFDYNDDIAYKVQGHLKNLIRLKRTLEQEGDYPEIALKYMNLDSKTFFYILDPQLQEKLKERTSPGIILRCLKQDATLIVEKLSLMEERHKYPWRQSLPRLNKIWEKMKVYFSGDIANKFVDTYLTSLFNMNYGDELDRLDTDLISASVFAVFQLADEQKKAEFMDKYAPASSKIEHDKIKRSLLDTQTYICRLHHYSRPPVPLAKTALYLKGDYAHMCRDMYNSYLVNLNPTLRAEFIYVLLDSPVSIQKHGLRLAFRSFEGSELKDLVCNIWKKTKNVSLRSNIYKLIVEKISFNTDVKELELFELLIELTAHLNQDDDESVFEYFRNYGMPEYVTGLHLQTAWKTVSVFTEKKVNIRRKIDIVLAMQSRMSWMDQDFIETLVYDHISKKLTEHKLRPEVNSDISPLNEALWDLVATYVVTIPTEAAQERSLNVLKLIVRECFNHWNETHNTDDYVFQLFFKEFASKLDINAVYFGDERLPRVSHIFQYLLEAFEDKFAMREMYSYFWDWSLYLLFRAVTDGRNRCDQNEYISFGSELGMIVKKLKDKNCYYSSFGGKILGKILSITQKLIIFKESSMSDNRVKILMAWGLARLATFETLELALALLPQDLNHLDSDNELRQVIHTIKTQNNDELIALLNDKFIYTDFKVRKILL